MVEAQRRSGAPLLVGFNRRYAPLATRLRELPGPRVMSYRVNAGQIGADHWLNDPALGGGCLKGEACHFVDFLCDQAAADPLTVSAAGFPSLPGLALAAYDNFTLQLRFGDGTTGTITYAADAPTGPGKERFETSSPGSFAVIEDFKRGAIWQPRKRGLGGRGQDKGFAGQYRAIAAIAAGEAEPPAPESFVISTLATLAAARSLASGNPEAVVRPAQ